MPTPSICLVAELPPPSGGMAVQAAWLTDLLRSAGQTVVNVQTNPLPPGSAWRRLPLARGIVNFYRFCRHLPRACAQSDIVHVFSNSYLSFFLFTAPAVLWAKWFDKPIVLHYHGGAAAAFLSRWGYLARPFIRSARTVIVPSSFLRETFTQNGVKTVEIPNVLAANLPYRKRTVLQPRLVMTRHLEPVYNIACGINAFRLVLDRHPGATIVIAGGGSERQSLERLAEKLGLGKQVTFTGPITNLEVLSLYDQSDIFVNSSNVDNQPVSILEAFACGLAVVSTAAGGIPHLVRDGEDALLARVNDPADLARQILRLLEEPALGATITENGLMRSRAFSGSEIYRQLSLVYDEAMSS
ncbi:MAG: glycosyltransferase family 4 protein [Betaproteobacteria bacterium]